MSYRHFIHRDDPPRPTLARRIVGELPPRRRQGSSALVDRPESARQLLREVADVIERDPASYDQSRWATVAIRPPLDVAGWRTLDVRNAGVCGIRCCVAAHAILAAGGSLVVDDLGDVLFCTLPNDRRRYKWVGSTAGRLLGLSVAEELVLFDAAARPRHPDGMPGALRAIADGATVESQIISPVSKYLTHEHPSAEAAEATRTEGEAKALALLGEPKRRRFTDGPPDDGRRTSTWATDRDELLATETRRQP